MNDSPGGRYLVFMYWNIGVMFAWNVYYWFLIFKGFDSNVAEWKCELEHGNDNEEYTACIDPKKMELFWATLYPFAIDSYFTFELYRWMKDAEEEDQGFQKMQTE